MYLQSIQKVLNGNLEYAKVNKDSILAIAIDTLPDLQLEPTEAELKLRKEVADLEQLNKQADKKINKKTKK